MKKSCPACGQPIADESKQFCSKCEQLPQISGGSLSSEDFERMSQVVSKRLKDDWIFKAQIAGAVILVVLAVIGVIDAIVGFNLKESMATHFRDQEKQATNRINERLVSLDDDVRKALAQVDVQMRSNISKSFEAQAIQMIIQDAAKSEAKSILESNVQPVVATFQTNVESKLAAMDESVKKGNATVAELQTYILFSKTVAAAQNDDRRAFDQLWSWSEDTNYPFTTESRQTWITILDAHNSPLVMEGLKVPWNESVDPTKLSLEQLKIACHEGSPPIRAAMVEYIWKRTDFPKRDRMQFLADVLRDDSSLRVVEYAGLYFAGESKTNLKRLAVKRHLEWWEKNKDSIR